MSPTYILNEDTHAVIRAIGVSHTACRYHMSFDGIFDLAQLVGSVFQCLNNKSARYPIGRIFDGGGAFSKTGG